MGLYLRAFCTIENIPTLEEILRWAKIKGYNLRVDKKYSEIDMNSREWEEVAIINEDGIRAFISEINKENGEEESLMREELEDFKALLMEVEEVPEENKKKVLEHLNKTKYIVVNQVLSAEEDEVLDNTSSIFLQYFVENCGAMIQEDEEGFYEGDKIIIGLE